MKTKNTLIIGGLLMIGKFGLAASLFIDLQEANNTTYLITLNGNKTYQTNGDITINHLNDGHNHVTIEERTFYYGSGWGNTTTNTFLAYDGHIYLPNNTKVNTQLYNNNLSITGSSSLNVPPVSPTCTTPTTNHHSPNHDWRNQQAMDDYTFNQLHQQLKKQPFDSDKTETLESVLINNKLSSLQMKQLLTLYTFDQYRLTAAKKGYDAVIDPASYFLVNETFTFQRYKNELTDYISQRQVKHPRRGKRNWRHVQQGMNQATFNLLIQQLDDATFDSRRLELLEPVFKHQNLQSIQMRRILETFDFDSYRLKAAKKGYHAVNDPVSYFVVNDTFDFDSNARSLQKYIATV